MKTDKRKGPEVSFRPILRSVDLRLVCLPTQEGGDIKLVILAFLAALLDTQNRLFFGRLGRGGRLGFFMTALAGETFEQLR